MGLYTLVLYFSQLKVAHRLSGQSIVKSVPKYLELLLKKGLGAKRCAWFGRPVSKIFTIWTVMKTVALVRKIAESDRAQKLARQTPPTHVFEAFPNNPGDPSTRFARDLSICSRMISGAFSRRRGRRNSGAGEAVQLDARLVPSTLRAFLFEPAMA